MTVTYSMCKDYLLIYEKKLTSANFKILAEAEPKPKSKLMARFDSTISQFSHYTCVEPITGLSFDIVATIGGVGR